MSRPEMSIDSIWALMCAGCNVVEIAEWYGVRIVVAMAWMQRAADDFARGEAA